jgi:amidase
VTVCRGVALRATPPACRVEAATTCNPVRARVRSAAVKVLRAYCERMEAVNYACNALTCWVDDAEAQAEELDAYLASTGKTKGPLHGVPCTVKDHYALKGYPVTMGLAKLRERQEAGGGHRHDAAVCTALMDAGAIIFAKTNMTQLGDTWGGGNPAYGDSLNPFDTLRTTGGSSSGEGCVVGCVPLV